MELLYSGTVRSVYVHGSMIDFRRWTESLVDPSFEVLMSAVTATADYPLAELVRSRKLWKALRNTDPKLYEIRKGPVRLFCCLLGPDVVILDWLRKKQQKARRADLTRIMERAREVLKYAR